MDIVELAMRAREAGPVCAACIGRTVGDRSRGLTNARRGEALLDALAMVEDVPVDELRTTDACWVCEGLTGRYDELAESVVEAIGEREFATYQVGTRLPAIVEENDRLLREDVRGDPDAGEALKRECNREVGKLVGALTGASVDFGRADVVAIVDIEADTVELLVNSAFVFGRYRKLERGIPQTRWPCSECDGTGRTDGRECATCAGSGLRYDRSVEQLVAPAIQAAMDGAEATFHGAGREDIDARMLGSGRPFVVEVAEPRRRSVDPDALEASVNEAADGAVEVRGLRLATHEMVEHVKELDADKTYEATVAFGAPVDPDDLEAAIGSLDGATIAQETPSRVSHRRAALTRERTVHEAEVVEADSTGAVIRIRGEGGLYIKELMHGDGGRTRPSLAGALGVGVEVEALDVVDVTAEGESSFARDDYLA